MTGHPATEVLSAYLDRELTEDVGKGVEDHVADCPDCRHRLDGLRRVIVELQSVTSAGPPEVLNERVRRAVLSERRRIGVLARLDSLLSGTWPWGPNSSIGLGFALVVALAAILYLFVDAVDRLQRKTAPLAVAQEEPLGDSREPIRAEVGGRVFASTDSGWIEVGLETREVSLRLDASSERGHRIRASLPWVEDLLNSGSSVTFESRGEVWELYRQGSPSGK